MSMNCDRRCFLGSMFAFAGAAALAEGRLGSPDLRVGIVSDIHLSMPSMHKSQGAIDTFIHTLKYFQERGVDAVLIAGDLTNAGRMDELRVVADSWTKVFGSITAGPEKIWVTGNHEIFVMNRAIREKRFDDQAYVQGLYRDVEKNWKELFGEEWTPFFIKRVKGYSFVGAHWWEWVKREKELKAFLAEHRAELDPSRPFFFTQHAHPQNTCYGTWTWHQYDGGRTSEILKDYPNAVAFSGHTHYSLTDERGVWQGAFTSVGTASLRWQGMPSGRENGSVGNGEGQRMGNGCGSVPQGMVMSVWGEEIVLERYDFQHMEKLGDDWVVPVLHGAKDPRKYDFGIRRAAAVAPEFAADAKITLKWGRGKANVKDKNSAEEAQLTVSFPAAKGRGDSLSRPFEYEVACEYVEADTVKPVRVKRVYHPGVSMNEKRSGKTATCVFGACELPIAKYRIAVTPMNSFGQRGRTIYVNGLNVES